MPLTLPAINRVYYQSDHLEISSAVARTEDFPVHDHPTQFQLEIVLRGATECGIGRQRFEVPQECFSIVNPNVEHYNITRRWKHAVFVIFPRRVLDETAWQMYRFFTHPVTFSDVVAPCPNTLRTAAHLLVHEAMRHDQPGNGLLLDSTLIQLGVFLLRSLHGNHTACANAVFPPSPSQAQLARAVDMIHSCYADSLSLNDLAQAAAMSRYHFLRSFKAHTGMTPYAYLLRVRLHHAATHLRSSSQSITDIATTCGFASTSRLSEAFRRHYDCSPSTYRRQG